MIHLLFYHAFTSEYSSFILKPRCKITWASCYSSIPSNLQPIQHHRMNHSALLATPSTIGIIPLDYQPPMSPLTDLEEDSEDMDTVEAPMLNPTPTASVYAINTKYNPDLDINTISKCPRMKNSRDTYYATQKERHLAEKAKVAVSLDDLKSKVRISCVFLN